MAEEHAIQKLKLAQQFLRDALADTVLYGFETDEIGLMLSLPVETLEVIMQRWDVK